jgi:hypothetical protein
METASQQRIAEVEMGQNVVTPMPQYQSHKKVWALKIAKIELLPTSHPDEVPGAIITPAEPSFGSFFVRPEYMAKHDPQVGGYFVQYDDGYKSFSPAKAFEEGYTRI